MKLVLRFDGKDVQEFVLEKSSITIGRGASNDITIDNLAVSGHHATVIKTDDGMMLKDNQSTNGTFVNEKKVTTHALKDGDIIGIGKHQILFSMGAASFTPIDEQSEATVMMSSDFQQQLQQELSKKQASSSQAKRTVKRKPEKKGFFAKLKGLFGG